MRKRRIRLVIAGATVIFGMAAAYAFAEYWRTPDNIADATTAGYRSASLALRPPVEGRDKPIVAVVADNAGTETTDFIVPYGMIKVSGVAEVRAVSSAPGAVDLMPALRVRADQTIADFDRATPEGADVVIVPAMHRQDNPVILEYLKRQAASGALIVSICDGAWVVANAGLFEGRKATGHWFSFNGLARNFPETTWVKNARIVTDGPVMSTTGVSASIPVSLAIVEALSDAPTAERLAARFGVDDWNRAHDSDDFGLSGQTVRTGLGNLAAVWQHEDLAVDLSEGFDEIALALQADAWSRTYRSNLFAVSEDGDVTSARGLVFVAVPDHGTAQAIALATSAAEAALDETLSHIERRYGARTAAFVANQLEYEWTGRASARPSTDGGYESQEPGA
jgi:transcriptional regulator GlxA family with amidase domain